MQRYPPSHAPFLCPFHYQMAFSSRQPVDIMRWVWNKPSFHICLAYRMKNNMKMTKLESHCCCLSKIIETAYWMPHTKGSLLRTFKSHSFTFNGKLCDLCVICRASPGPELSSFCVDAAVWVNNNTAPLEFLFFSHLFINLFLCLILCKKSADDWEKSWFEHSNGDNSFKNTSL